MAVITYKQGWQAAQDDLGPHAVFYVDRVAIGPDPGRWLISDDLRSDGRSPSRIGHWWQSNTGSAGAGRIIHEEPSLGALAVDMPFAVAQQIDAEYETSWPLPGSTDTGTTDLHGVRTTASFVTAASWDIWYPDRLTFTTVVGQYIYDLPSWLDDEARILRDAEGRPLLYDPAIQTGYPLQPAPWRYGRLIMDTGSPSLQLQRAYLSGGGTFQLGAIRPAGSLVSAAESTTGPTTYAQTINAEPKDLLEVTKLRMYRYLATASHITDEERQRYAGLVAPQEALVRATVRHYLPRDEMPQATGKAA